MYLYNVFLYFFLALGILIFAIKVRQTSKQLYYNYNKTNCDSLLLSTVRK